MGRSVSEVISKARMSATTSIARRHLSDDARVLEVGHNDASLRDYIAHREWLTIDKYGDPDLNADLDGPEAHIPLPDDSVDAIFCTEVLEHLVVGSYLVAEMGRVLRPDGVAIISVPNMVSFKAIIFAILGRVPSLAASGDCGPPLRGTGLLVDGDWVAGHVVDFDMQRLKGYLKRGGLTVIDSVTTPFSLGVPPRDRVYLPWFPKRFADYLIVAARPTPQ
jgi:SAM-dependent methyltransferase